MTDNQIASKKLYDLMLREGYPQDFAALIATEMHTEFTANRMYGYIALRGLIPLEEVADEMLAIESDRDRLMNKHSSEHAQAAINEFYRSGERE